MKRHRQLKPWPPWRLPRLVRRVRPTGAPYLPLELRLIVVDEITPAADRIAAHIRELGTRLDAGVAPVTDDAPYIRPMLTFLMDLLRTDPKGPCYDCSRAAAQH